MPKYHKDDRITVQNTKKFKLKNYSTNYTGGLTNEKDTRKEREENTEDIAKLQEQLYAEGKKGLLLIFQAMDAAGKDSTIEHVLSGVNPQGCKVLSFKQPSKSELAHDFLWRCSKEIPERGYIGIFNRSHYEEVLVCKVHPEYVLGQNIGDIESVQQMDDVFWSNRYESIADFEKHLSRNGYTILKFFLNVSKEEQKNRFLNRIDVQEKNWKFNSGDLSERALWDDYQSAYEEMISATHTPECPWYIIPADHKWFMRYAVSEIIKDTLKKMNPQFPQLSKKETQKLNEARTALDTES